MTAPIRANRRPAALLWPALATLVALAILVGLGIWQLERKAWKEGLLAQINARAFGPPGEILPEAAWPSFAPGTEEFRRVTLRGTFVTDAAVRVHGLAQIAGRTMPGVYVFAPLRLAGGAVVLVNRGFIPTGIDAGAPAAAGESTVTGLVRAPETRTAFVPENDPARGEWFTRDIGAMTISLALARVAPFYIDADSTPNPGGWPLGGQTRLSLPNDHLQYALTWFGLALTLVGVFSAFAWRRLRGPASGEQLEPNNAGHDQADARETGGARRLAE